jgi:hypothetical protein
MTRAHFFFVIKSSADFTALLPPKETYFPFSFLRVAAVQGRLKRWNSILPFAPGRLRLWGAL